MVTTLDLLITFIFIKHLYFSGVSMKNKTTEKEEVYKRYKANVNMSYAEFKAWSQTPCSRKASVDRRPITRNLILLKKPFKNWTETDIQEAKKTISFNSRMKKVRPGKKVKGCELSKRDISLLNWAWDPRK